MNKKDKFKMASSQKTPQGDMAVNGVRGVTKNGKSVKDLTKVWNAKMKGKNTEELKKILEPLGFEETEKSYYGRCGYSSSAISFVMWLETEEEVIAIIDKF